MYLNIWKFSLEPLKGFILLVYPFNSCIGHDFLFYVIRFWTFAYKCPWTRPCRFHLSQKNMQIAFILYYINNDNSKSMIFLCADSRDSSLLYSGGWHGKLFVLTFPLIFLHFKRQIIWSAFRACTTSLALGI